MGGGTAARFTQAHTHARRHARTHAHEGCKSSGGEVGECLFTVLHTIVSIYAQTPGQVGESGAEQCTLFCTIMHKHTACGAGYCTVLLTINAPRWDVKPGGEAGYQPQFYSIVPFRLLGYQPQCGQEWQEGQ